MDISKRPDSSAANQRFWTPSRVVITLVVAGLLAALGFSSCTSNDEISKTSPNKTANAPGVKPAQPPVANSAEPPVVPQELRDTKVETLDGESLRLSDYANKVVVVNIWATWCGPCRQEMPELVKMSNDYKSRGLVVLGLATTYNERNDPANGSAHERTPLTEYRGRYHAERS